MAILLAATAAVACVFYIYVLVQFRREQARPRRIRVRQQSRVVQFRKGVPHEQRVRRLTA